jgi:hypothetical protein
MRPVIITKSLAAASANNIALVQTVGSTGVVLLNGTTGGVLDTQRQVIIASGGNDSTKTATIVGLNSANNNISEVLTLANVGNAVSALSYMTVTSITLSAAAAGNITVGTDTTGSTDWIMPNFNMTPFELRITTQVTGSVTYNIETTNDIYWVPLTGKNAVPPIVNVFAVASAQVAAAQTSIDAPITGYRFTITAGTGTLTAQCSQSGIVNF